MATSTCAPSSTTLGLSQTFTKLKKQGKVGLIPYITAGDPDLSTTAEALKLLDACGADIIELGVPHTHPFADGPIIQASIRRALARGTDINSIVSMLKTVVPNLSCPIAMCTYFSPILDYGIPKFMATIQNAGVKGILVPGAPPEYHTILREECMKNNIEMVLFATPTTPKDKMKKIVEESEGFVYLVSSTGVTGPRPAVNPDVQLLLQDIKKETSKAVGVGFGISKPEHVKQVAEWGGDGVIVGSALVKLLGDANSADEGLLRLKDFTESLKASLP